jgi:hypothetical protein
MPGSPTNPDKSPGSGHAAGGDGQFGGDSVCVLWHHPDVPPPPELLASLRRHGAGVIACGGAYRALAEGCKVSRSAGQPRAVLLLLVDPPTLPEPGAAAFVRAARRYNPRSAIWWFAANQNPAFRAISPQDLAAWEGQGGQGGEGAKDAGPAIATRPMGKEARITPRGGQPKLRLTEDPGAGEAQPKGGLHLIEPGPGQPVRPPAPRDALSAEELAVLLGDPVAPPGVANGGNGGGGGGGGGGREVKRQ